MKLISMHICSGFLVVTSMLLIPTLTDAQINNTYSPRKVHSADSKELIDDLESRFEEESKSMAATREVRQINFDRRIFFLEKVLHGSFIKDDSLETYVNRVMNKIISNSELNSHSRRVLILESPHVNAACYGQGIYAVTVGLLGRIENENQLAFILAHEIAHDELGHIRTRIVQEADLNLDEKTREQTIKIISGKIVQEEVREYRKLVYAVSRHSRNNELRADSMAIVLLNNAHYDKREAFSALTILQTAQSPKYQIGAELFLPFHSEAYPFQDYWLNDRLSVFSKKYKGTFLYNTDSIESHPAMELRKTALRTYVTNHSQEQNNQPIEFVNAVTEIAAFQSVESAYKNKEYDLCLYLAMQLYNRYPHNDYLVSRMGKVLIDLYEARNANRFEQYVSKYTTNYSDELKLINSFLYNLSTEEIGEVAFHFLNNNSNRKGLEKSHNYLLWKISSLTYRNDIKEQMKVSYKQKFNTSIATYSYR